MTRYPSTTVVLLDTPAAQCTTTTPFFSSTSCFRALVPASFASFSLRRRLLRWLADSPSDIGHLCHDLVDSIWFLDSEASLGRESRNIDHDDRRDLVSACDW